MAGQKFGLAGCALVSDRPNKRWPGSLIFRVSVLELCRIGLFPADVNGMITALVQSGLLPTRKVPETAENLLSSGSSRGGLMLLGHVDRKRSLWVRCPIT